MARGKTRDVQHHLRDWRVKHFLRVRDGIAPPRTPAERLMTSFDAAVTARVVSEALHSCLITDPADDVAARMDALEFDVLGVRLESGGMVGYVERRRLDELALDQAVVPFLAGHLISDSAPLYEVMSVLRAAPRVFVLSGPSVQAIITRADLQKEPVRVFAFALVTTLEMQLTAILRKAYPGSEWTDQLSDGRVARAQELFEARVERNEQIDLFDCLQLGDKRDLLSKLEPVRRQLGFASKRECVAVLKRIEALRDRLAHAQDLVAGTDWEDTIDTIEDMDLLLQQAAAS